MAKRKQGSTPPDRRAVDNDLFWSSLRLSAQLAPAADLEIEIGWAEWLRKIAPRVFSAEPAWFHAEYWEWMWPLMHRRALRETVLDVPTSALLILGRGLGKSTTVEFTTMAEGALVEQAFGVYISSTQDKANEHVAAVRDAIESSQVARFYPGLSNPRVGRFGNQRGWRQDAVYTDNGFALVGAGLDKGVRGLKDIAQRPTLFVFDDLDERDDTPLIVDKKVKTLTHDVMPMREMGGAVSPLVIFAQNLIHHNSVMAKCYRKEIPLLSHRKMFGPVNTFKDDLEIVRDPDNPSRSVIVAGTPNWGKMTVGAGQSLLDDMGEVAFRTECQNEMNAAKEERVLSNYDETFHIISWTMFEKVFGSRKIPTKWELHCGHDWGSSGPNAHPAVITFVAVASKDSGHPGDLFLFYSRTAEAGCTPHTIARQVIDELPDYLWHPGASEAKALLRQSDKLVLKAKTDPLTEERMWQMRQEAGRALPIARWVMSHEETQNHMKTYVVKWGFGFGPCDPGKTVGISQIMHYLEPDMGRRHPFKPTVMGRPAMYWIVDDAQYLEMVDDRGLKRARTEALTLKWDLNVAGRDVPTKRGDDFVDSLKMICQGFKFTSADLDSRQKAQLKMDERFRDESVPEDPSDGFMMARAVALEKAEEEVKREEEPEWIRAWKGTV